MSVNPAGNPVVYPRPKVRLDHWELRGIWVKKWYFSEWLELRASGSFSTTEIYVCYLHITILALSIPNCVE